MGLVARTPFGVVRLAFIGSTLAPAVTSNPEGLDLTPVFQYVADQQVATRSTSGSGSDLGAFER